ncbi:CREB3 regulatory factor [Lates calcarifer]|uniref:CREB3 regulatory factor n=1 Tax=Lates calcarifer TaxID=8187 RepID=A0A4W6F639_LATCA|nr:CREB3 regulatory factor [Lates calcarifer]XP_018547282.1 CREB3 regulatory factor [Lates calcarifer]XP_018547284.1 CREB3 regulatory factor [Lates calcarifer]XP_018547286.1 CREB3 regulatory factor [Lates calcarifer]XP_018547287.1 CREB3 regulatory factor [Lates calcarifer]XP_050934327.1 CREB3 regulatory factor [Lates calcarifer]
MPQPSVSGMEPPFGDAFQNYSFADQALTSTELLATSSDPDFMYELDRDMTHRQSPCGDSLVGVGDGGKEVEGCVDQLMGLGECETVYSSSAFEQWDSYWEDLTRYTRLASCDIWGTKEVDFLGLDDFSSPYQDEEVISRTPTLAQLNSEDSQPVCEALYPPVDLTLPAPQPQPQSSQFPCHSKRPLVPGQGLGPSSARSSTSSTSSSRPSRSLLPDFPEGSQKATRPVPSSTETMAKTQNHLSFTQDHGQAQSKPQGRGTKMAAPTSHGSDFVRKAKVRVSAVHKAQPDMPSQTDFERSDPPLPLSQPQDEKASTSASATLVGLPGAVAGGSGSLTGFERRAEGTGRREGPVGWSATMPQLVEASQALEGSTSGLVSSGDSMAGASGGGGGGGVLVVEGTEKSKEEEHNYSLFLTRSRLAGRALSQLEEDEEEEDEEEAEEEEGDGLEPDDEDHDEGFGSEHELSENEEEEEEEEDEDYEADKDDDMSDAFSEPGCDMELMEDIKGLTAGVSSRKRGKRRYFWEYSEQLTPSKQERMLKPSEWDRHTLPSNLYQKNGPLHGKYMLKKSRRTDVEDLTPNPRKLLQIGTELRKLNKVISDLTPVSELPLTARPRSRKEKNKLASRACRLKKKAQYEANKVKLWGLSTEYDRLLFVINAIKEEIVARVEDSSPRPTNMTDTLERLIQETLVSSPVAGQTSDFVNKILENTGRGDPTGGLVGLRVPTSKI